jgi:hypothetical protein
MPATAERTEKDVKMDLFEFEKIAGVPLHYDRLKKSDYGTRGKPCKGSTTQDFFRKLEACFKEIWVVCPWGEAEVIVTAGTYVNKGGNHGKGRAMDLDCLFWKDKSFVTYYDGFQGRDKELYLGIEAIIRKHFGNVKNFDYVHHEDHFHVDDGKDVGFDPKWDLGVMTGYLQAVSTWMFNHPVGLERDTIHREDQRFNRIYDKKTKNAIDLMMQDLGMSGTHENLKDLENWKELLTKIAGKAFGRKAGNPSESLPLSDMIEKKKIINICEMAEDHGLVREIQSRLSSLGYLSPTEIDGALGPITRSAISRFCADMSLNNASTGVFGPTFASRLLKSRGTMAMNPPVSSAPPVNMPSELKRALKFTLKWEGGYVNHPNDHGGATNKGIIQSEYDDYRLDKHSPPRSVKEIEDSEVMDIYWHRYWEPSHAELMTSPLAVVHFDTAVNFGVTGAVKFLQEALNLTADGIFGPATLSALQRKNNKDLALEIVEGRKAYRHLRVKKDPTQKVFLEGWLNRDKALGEFV